MFNTAARWDWIMFSHIMHKFWRCVLVQTYILPAKRCIVQSTRFTCSIGLSWLCHWSRAAKNWLLRKLFVDGHLFSYRFYRRWNERFVYSFCTHRLAGDNTCSTRPILFNTARHFSIEIHWWNSISFNVVYCYLPLWLLCGRIFPRVAKPSVPIGNVVYYMVCYTLHEWVYRSWCIFLIIRFIGVLYNYSKVKQNWSEIWQFSILGWICAQSVLTADSNVSADSLLRFYDKATSVRRTN